MPRKRSLIRDKAKDIYIESKRKLKPKDLALKLGVPITQIRKWKSLDQWDLVTDEVLPIKTEKVFPIKGNIPKQKGIKNKSVSKKRLTEKQKLFCTYYLKYHSATKAYQKANKCSYENAHGHAYETWKLVAVKEEVARQAEQFNSTVSIDTKAIIQKYIDIAFADITDFMEFGKKDIEMPTKDGVQIIPLDYTSFKDSNNVDGSLISEVKQSKDGVSIKLVDKMKALEWLGKHVDILETATQRRLEIEKQKINGNVDPDEVLEDDGFINAMKTNVKDIWDDVEENEEAK